MSGRLPRPLPAGRTAEQGHNLQATIWHQRRPSSASTCEGRKVRKTCETAGAASAASWRGGQCVSVTGDLRAERSRPSLRRNAAAYPRPTELLTKPPLPCQKPASLCQKVWACPPQGANEQHWRSSWTTRPAGPSRPAARALDMLAGQTMEQARTAAPQACSSSRKNVSWVKLCLKPARSPPPTCHLRK